jgi:Zn-dependent protease
MFTTRWRLFRVRGIPINVDLSWLVILALLTWTLISFFEKAVPGLTEASYILLGLGTALAFFLCIVLHELGHALTARRLGMPLRGITLFLFGGVAELGGEPPSAGAEFLMAIAGPVVSAILAGLLWLMSDVGAQAGWDRALVIMLAYLAVINAVVLVLNLIPAFPLDGGRVFRSILWGVTGNLRRSTRWASLLGQGFAWLLIAYGVYELVSGYLFNGIWMGLIGMFLNNAARASYQQVLIRELLQGEPVRRFMNPDPIVVPPNIDLRHWVDEYVYRYHHKMFPVVSDGRLEGIITTGMLARYPREEWEFHTVGEAMRHDLRGITLPPDVDALRALEQMQRTDLSRLLVTEDDHLLGIISLKDLLRFLQLKLELADQGVGEPGPQTPVPPPSRRETPALP